MKKQSSGAVKWLLIAVSVLFLAVMLVLPLVYVLVTAFRQGIQPFLAAVTDKYALKSVQLTIEATLFAVVLNTIFGLFAAWSITKFQFRGKKVISTLIDLPLTVSPIIAGLIFVLTYGDRAICIRFSRAWTSESFMRFRALSWQRYSSRFRLSHARLFRC